MDYFSRNDVRQASGSHRITFDKALAGRFLTWNLDTQRPLSEPFVKSLILTMNKGKFDDNNGDTIRVDNEGNLIDGQHRLTAFYRSDLETLTFTVTFGLSPQAFKTIDDGRKRTPGDILGINGISNHTHVAAIARLSIRFLNDGNTRSDTNSKLSNQDILEFVEEHQTRIAQSTQFAINTYQTSDKLLTVTQIGAFHFLTYNRYGARVEEFFESLATGTNLSGNSPILKLRQLLIKYSKNVQTKLTAKSKHLYIAKSLHLFLNNQERSSLYISTTDTVLKYFPYLSDQNGEE